MKKLLLLLIPIFFISCFDENEEPKPPYTPPIVLNNKTYSIGNDMSMFEGYKYRCVVNFGSNKQVSVETYLFSDNNSILQNTQKGSYTLDYPYILFKYDSIKGGDNGEYSYSIINDVGVFDEGRFLLGKTYTSSSSNPYDGDLLNKVYVRPSSITNEIESAKYKFDSNNVVIMTITNNYIGNSIIYKGQYFLNFPNLKLNFNSFSQNGGHSYIPTRFGQYGYFYKGNNLIIGECYLDENKD